MKTRVIKFYGSYFIEDKSINTYLMIDTFNEKIRLIDKHCFAMIELLQDIKADIKKLV